MKIRLIAALLGWGIATTPSLSLAQQAGNGPPVPVVQPAPQAPIIVAPTPPFTAPANQWPTGLSQSGWSFGNTITPAGGNTPSALPTILGRIITPMDFGAVGNGTTDDTTAVQACINASVSSGWPCWFDTMHKYLISATLTASGPVKLRGNIPIQSSYATSCPAGIIVNSNITALSLMDVSSSTVEGLCFQMGTAAGQRTTGAAIAIGSNTVNVAATVSRNTIIFPYNGIVIGGTSNGTSQTNEARVYDNQIISPYNDGIAIGLNSTNASTHALLHNNMVLCFATPTTGVGLQLNDGAIEYDASADGPYNCKIGMAIQPGAGQLIGGSLVTGVVGDTAQTDALLIQPTNATGQVLYVTFNRIWTSCATTTCSAVTINANGGQAKGLIFNGDHFANNASGTITANLFNITSGNSITISGSQFLITGGGTATGYGLLLGGATAGIHVIGNLFAGSNGTMDYGIGINSGATAFALIGNYYSVATQAISNGAGTVAGAYILDANNTTMLYNGNVGATCSGTPSTSFATINGYVTHC
jgi:hypothetical protein